MTGLPITSDDRPLRTHQRHKWAAACHASGLRLGQLRQMIETMNAGEQRTVLSALKLMTAPRQRFVHDHPGLNPSRDHKDPLPA